MWIDCHGVDANHGNDIHDFLFQTQHQFWHIVGVLKWPAAQLGQRCCGAGANKQRFFMIF